MEGAYQMRLPPDVVRYFADYLNAKALYALPSRYTTTAAYRKRVFSRLLSIHQGPHHTYMFCPSGTIFIFCYSGMVCNYLTIRERNGSRAAVEEWDVNERQIERRLYEGGTLKIVVNWKYNDALESVAQWRTIRHLNGCNADILSFKNDRLVKKEHYVGGV